MLYGEKMTDYWKLFPAQSFDDSLSVLTRCATMLLTEIGRGLESEEGDYYCSQKKQTSFAYSHMKSWMAGYGYPSNIFQIVLRRLFESKILAQQQVVFVNEVPFYKSQNVMRFLNDYKENPSSNRKPIAKNSKTVVPISEPFHDQVTPETINESLIVFQIPETAGVGPHNIRTIKNVSNLKKVIDAVGHCGVRHSETFFLLETEIDPSGVQLFGDTQLLQGYSKRVQLFSEKDSPIIDGRAVKRLVGRQYQLVRELLRVYPEGLTTTEMDKCLGGESKTDLKRLTNKQGWADVIVRAGVNYQDKTRIL